MQERNHFSLLAPLHRHDHHHQHAVTGSSIVSYCIIRVQAYSPFFFSLTLSNNLQRAHKKKQGLSHVCLPSSFTHFVLRMEHKCRAGGTDTLTVRRAMYTHAHVHTSVPMHACTSKETTALLSLSSQVPSISASSQFSHYMIAYDCETRA